jgi:hypothetical protein
LTKRKECIRPTVTVEAILGRKENKSQLGLPLKFLDKFCDGPCAKLVHPMAGASCYWMGL